MAHSQLMIFVGGLESSTTNEELLKYFGCFGVIRFCEVQCWKNNPSKCRGFALMDVADYTTYENILLTPHRLKDRPIEVKRMITDKDELEEHTKDMNDRKVFVSNLPKKLTDLQLAEYFGQYGTVELAYIIKHHKDNKSKGFGFVLYCSKKDKEDVIRLSDKQGFNIEGKKIACTSYKMKTNKSNGSSNSVSFQEISRKVQGGSDPLHDKSNRIHYPEVMKPNKLNSLRNVDTPDQLLKLNIRSPNWMHDGYFNSMISTKMGNTHRFSISNIPVTIHGQWMNSSSSYQSIDKTPSFGDHHNMRIRQAEVAGRSPSTLNAAFGDDQPD